MANSAITVPDMCVGGLTTAINLREEFSKGARGAAQPELVSFDGKIQASDVSGSAEVIDQQKIAQAVQQITSIGASLSRSVSISVDERSGDYILQVQNAETKEVVRQIPAEEVLKIAEVMSERNADLRLARARSWQFASERASLDKFDPPGLSAK